jgi:predicted lactoylglutathione lyase
VREERSLSINAEIVCFRLVRRTVGDLLQESKRGIAILRREGDFGFMYGRSFEDPDGHIWEVMRMDAKAATQQVAEPVAS